MSGQPTFDEAYSTEIRLREAICEVSLKPDYTSFQSPNYPSYFAANGIEIAGESSRTFTEWEGIHEAAVEVQNYPHKTFFFRPFGDNRTLISEAQQKGYEVVENAYMYLNDLHKLHDFDAMAIRPVKSEEQKQKLRAAKHHLNQEEAWYSREVYDNLLDREAAVTDALDIHWFYMPGGEKCPVASSLGMFRVGKIARLQDVFSDPLMRRKGLCTQMVSFATDLALNEWGCEAVIVSADVNYHAYSLYKSLGFHPIGNVVEAIKYGA